MRYLLTVVLMAVLLPLHAQRRLTGIVRDTQGAVVPFAVVELPARQLGAQADQDGQFYLYLPASVASTDSLSVSALGYLRQRLPMPAGAELSPRLRPASVALRGVTVRAAKVAPILLGPRSSTDFESSGFGQSGLTKQKNTGWQVARLFAAPPKGYIDEVRFYVHERSIGDCSKRLMAAPFRVRLYAADGPDGAPGTDLLTASVVSAAAHPGWHTVDVRRFNIPTPKAGFYAAMEWLYTADRYLCTYETFLNDTGTDSFRTSYGQVLGGLDSRKVQTTCYVAGRGWRPALASDAAIQVLVQP